MTVAIKIAEAPKFNAFAAYQEEREYSRKLEQALSRSLALLSIECDRRDMRGEDVAHVRAFISEQRKVF